MDELTGPYLFDRLAAERLSDDTRIDLDVALTVKNLESFVNGEK